MIFYTFKTNILTLGYTDFCGHCYDLSRNIHAQNTPDILAQWTLEYPNISPPLHPPKKTTDDTDTGQTDTPTNEQRTCRTNNQISSNFKTKKSDQSECTKILGEWLSGIQSEASGYSGYSAAIKRPLDNRR